MTCFYDLKCGPNDNPTIGLILCADTSKDIAKYSILRDNKQLFAAKYLTYLPSEDELKREIERQKEIFQILPFESFNEDRTPKASSPV